VFFCVDFEVNIQLPPKGSAKEEIITITGLEADALAAKDAILKASGTDSCVTSYRHKRVSVADPGCLSRIRISSIPDLHQRI
jgi:hypothetical protein